MGLAAKNVTPQGMYAMTAASLFISAFALTMSPNGTTTTIHPDPLSRFTFTPERTVMAKAKTERAVVICTAKRGVFFGYVTEEPRAIIERGNATLARPRICVYWSSATKGILGLASIGPQPGSRISPAPPEIAVSEITAVISCSDEAINKWESSPWN